MYDPVYINLLLFSIPQHSNQSEVIIVYCRKLRQGLLAHHLHEIYHQTYLPQRVFDFCSFLIVNVFCKQGLYYVFSTISIDLAYSLNNSCTLSLQRFLLQYFLSFDLGQVVSLYRLLSRIGRVIVGTRRFCLISYLLIQLTLETIEETELTTFHVSILLVHAFILYQFKIHSN